MSRAVSGGMLLSCLVSHGDMSGDHAVDLIVVIVAGPESRHMAQRTRDDTLGLAVRDATMAFVLWSSSPRLRKQNGFGSASPLSG